tara:strand:+ start:2503 stop:3777 length:1275 start_codon:yes stop_codon:yes gene_type:complete
MNLSEIREYIGNILDYQPEITTYQKQLDDVINEQYFRLFNAKPYTFAQKQVLIKARKDVDLPNLIVTNASNLITLSVAGFTQEMEGMVIEFDGVEYEIAWVDTVLRAYLTEVYAGATATLTAKVKFRYIDMPSDCVEIMQVMKRAMTLTPQEPGRMVPVTRYEDEYYNLPLNEVNLPNYWVPYDDYSIGAPKFMQFTKTTSGSGHGIRTLELAATWSYGGRESALSKVTTLSLIDTEKVQFTYTNLANSTGLHYKVYVRCTEIGMNKFYHVSDDAGTAEFAPSGGGTFTFTLPVSGFTDAFETLNTRYSEVDGNTQRIRLYPRQDQDFELTVRYMYRPKKLIDDADTPEIPSISHQILAYMTLRDIFVKFDNTAQAQLYDRKVVQEILKIDQRYLNQIAKRYIKRMMTSGRTDPVPLYTPLTRT